jgi:hypothetical protein
VGFLFLLQSILRSVHIAVRGGKKKFKKNLTSKKKGVSISPLIGGDCYCFSGDTL